jgi:hypothetical protein
MSGFSLLGEQVVDLSSRGMLVECSRPLEVGAGVLVSFRAPGHEGRVDGVTGLDNQDDVWFDAEAVVARVVAGRRWCDEGYGAGLEFTYFEKSCRHELLARLARFPLPAPKVRDRPWLANDQGDRRKRPPIPRGTFSGH